MKDDAYILSLQRLIDAGGSVPADIPLFARIDCLIKQRDGVCPIPEPGHFGRLELPVEEAIRRTCTHGRPVILWPPGDWYHEDDSTMCTDV